MSRPFVDSTVVRLLGLILPVGLFVLIFDAARFVIRFVIFNAVRFVIRLVRRNVLA